MATHEFILTVLVLYINTASSVLVQTFPRTLPSGRIVDCNLCPPGFRRQKHCTETQPTVCQPCRVGFYTEHWNYMHDCLPCNICSSDKLEAQQCTSTTNRVCRCKEGFYSDMDFCRAHTVCQDGFGVKEKGTKEKDTVCEPCTKGFYSSRQSGHSKCVNHTKCTSEEKLLFHGNNYLDNVCVTCDSIIKHGWVKAIVPAFIEIFKHHNSRRIHQSIFQLDRKRRAANLFSSGHSSNELIQAWFNQATEEQIIGLPKMFQGNVLKNLVKKIKQRIEKIVEEVCLCRNTVHDLLH